MATKSILKNITIKDKATTRSLVNALENAGEKQAKEVEFSRGVRQADRDLIRTVFGEKNDDKTDGIQ